MVKVYCKENDCLEARRPLKILCSFESNKNPSRRGTTRKFHNCQCMAISGKNKPAFAIISEHLEWCN
jgi:hypothetical protein